MSGRRRMDPVDGQDRRAATSQALRVVRTKGHLERAGAIMPPNPFFATEPNPSVGIYPHHGSPPLLEARLSR